MSLSALTTAMAIAATPVQTGEAPAPVNPSASPPVVLAQSAQPSAPPQPAGPSDPVEPADPASTDPAPSTQPESEALPPAMGDAEVVVTGRRPSSADPLEDINAASFDVTQKVDDAIIAPVASAYEDTMPRVVRKGLSNFLHNLAEPIVALNFILQLKPGKAAETLGRFVINTAVGGAGFVDVAKRDPFNLPHRRNGMANTLGFYGVKPGPYFYLPLIGATTLRDFIGDRLDMFMLPSAFGNQFKKPIYVIPVAAMSELNRRIEHDDELKQIRATRDPYVAQRTFYLQKRQAEIDELRGRKPAGDSSNPAPPPASPAPAKEPSAQLSANGQ